MPAIAYRVGAYHEFKESLLARLSSTDFPQLASLRARGDDDFAVALLDGFATMADVLTFYQERIANETYLRTAVERRSVVELSDLVGYRPSPGVAASTYVAFTLEETLGARERAADPVTVPKGTRVQSVPGPDEKPQTFETVEEVEARVAWNAIPAQQSEAQAITRRTLELFLMGTDSRLEPGAVILFIKEDGASGPLWDAKTVRTVHADGRRGYTRITWQSQLTALTATADTPLHPGEFQVFALRQRAALFGHNAPDRQLLGLQGAWPDSVIQDGQIDLDAQYQKILTGSWFVLAEALPIEGPAASGQRELHRVQSVTHLARSAFGISATITRLISEDSLGGFEVDRTLVWAQSEQLPLGRRILPYPVYGSSLPLNSVESALRRGQAIAISGKLQRVRVSANTRGLDLDADGELIRLQPGDSLQVLSPLEFRSDGDVRVPEPAEVDWDPSIAYTVSDGWWRVKTHDGRAGVVFASIGAGGKFERAPADEEDVYVSEVAVIVATAVSGDGQRTVLTLGAPMRHCYDRQTVRVNANVAAATHGETVNEVLGSGDAGVRDQKFRLKHSPLTYVSAPTPSGRASTLEVRVNDLKWDEVPSLFDRGPGDRVLSSSAADDGTTTVHFGDGIEGARPPSGQDNVRARYRQGLGIAGNLAAGRLTTLLDRPLGVTAVTNPDPATGGDDRESRDSARSNAPLTVRTLDRAVSLLDYEDLARSFAGVAKALATWIQGDPARAIFITVAGPNGADIPKSSTVYENLVRALRRFGDPLIPLRVASYEAVAFRLHAGVRIAPNALASKVLPAVRQLLLDRFGFSARSFGQPVAVDEVSAVIHSVPEVAYVDVDQLYVSGQQEEWNFRLDPASPHVDGNSVHPAQLLTIDGSALELSLLP